MFDVFHGTAPEYLTDLCSRCSDQRLRSSTRGNFVVRRTRTRFADSSFTVAGPAAWNSLPVHIRTIQSHSAFCRHLKTHLFANWLNCINIYFSCIYYLFLCTYYFNQAHFVTRCWAPVEQRHSQYVMMMMMMMPSSIGVCIQHDQGQSVLIIAI